ncbi:MAG: hypothetical protein EZS28_038689, partial [Streblomastix strix]
MTSSSMRSATGPQVLSVGVDLTTEIPNLIQDLESDNTKIHVSALRRILDIIVDNPGNKELILQNKIISLMNKFIGNLNQSEEFALSTTILHLIGVRGTIDDKTLVAGAATDSFIRMIIV